MQQNAVDVAPPGGGFDGPARCLQLPEARQEDQHGAAGLGLVQPVAFEGPQHLALQPLVLPRRLVGDRDRMAAALAADHAGPVQLGGQRFQIEGGRHHQQPQLRAQQAAGLTHQGQGQIRFGLALMEFVEDHAGHPFEGGIGLETAQEQAGSDHLQAGGRRGARFQSDAVPHPAANGFAQIGRQALGGRPGRQPARLQQQEPALLAEALQQGQGDPGGFARAGFSLEQQGGPGPKGGGDGREAAVNGQGGRQRTWRRPSTGW